MESSYIPPGSIAQPTQYAPITSPPTANASDEAGRVQWASDGTNKRPLLNLINPHALPGLTDLSGSVHAPLTPRRQAWMAVVVVGVLAMGAAGAGYVWLSRRPAPAVAVVRSSPSPSPRASVTPNATPSPTPSVTPTPTPAPTPAPLTVTAPSVAPTAQHPQTSTVTSKTGLWLRSSPTSVDRSNIITWMPDGATMSIDAIGDFWWHGSYKGQSGYFASKYTN